MPEDVQQLIKEAFLKLLVNPNRQAMKNAGQALAAVAVVEVPAGKWTDFLQMMASNSTHEIYEFRLAAVETLGLFTEFLEQVDGHLTYEQTCSIL